ncbi:carboxypeptidase-like regulatory domain-containing protein [Tenacibaculum sp. IB213877]|uniref:carboxypeptidase-like regulatory domain-containing protein n=1 Tax=Tenacibaculum sp. IB213877 TaxID=3097351 RepID=UPI002A5AB8AE|nr:carboxypeptidase-like regulatory domain-containing protein [Tenacibaculum sp. IB213877]MDY0779402.1 carboxypeptidase-like regulatory domain-containing protein [Tenacibaculum sp. IB213877]
MQKLLLYILFLTVSIYSFSQTNRKILQGEVLDQLGPLIDTHIVNITTKEGTFTNDKGQFSLFAKTNDSIQITSVGYKTLKFKVNIEHFGIQQNQFFLQKNTVILDEVEVKNHNLQGNLTTDIKQTPKDKRADALAKTMDFSNINMDAPTIRPIDEINRTKAPDARLITDPTARFAGVGTSSSIPFKHSEKLWALRKELAFKKSMPAKLLSELGEKFFFEELKIPVEKYYHFLEYCNPLGIEKMYQEGKTIQVIKIFRQEHKTYLEIIKKE